jgi:hypothetical protein
MYPGAVGAGQASTGLSRVIDSVPLAALATPRLSTGKAESLGDSVATLLSDGVSAPDIARLIDLIESPLPAQAAAQLQDLLGTLVSSAAAGDVPAALNALSEIAALDPSRPNILRSDPAIASIRANVDQFLDHHTTLARLDAVGRMEQAAREADPSGDGRLPGWDMRPETMLVIANRIFDAGGLANYARAAELSQLIIDGSRWAPANISLPADALGAPRTGRSGGAVRKAMRLASGGWSARLRSLWLRAPLLILLLAWLLVGIAGGGVSMLWHRLGVETWPGSLATLAFQVWGLGFLAMVAFGFYANVRKARF